MNKKSAKPRLSTHELYQNTHKVAPTGPPKGQNDEKENHSRFFGNGSTDRGSIFRRLRRR
jgi:hypothetical protein